MRLGDCSNLGGVPAAAERILSGPRVWHREAPARLPIKRRGEQRFQPLAKGGVCAANGLKKRRSFGDGLFKGQREQGGLSILWRWHG